MSGRCFTCRFWHPIAFGSDPYPETNGICRRHAPQGPVIKDDNHGWSLFKPMNSNQWCCEHEAKRWGAIAKRVADFDATRSAKATAA